jgi:hypothetical protein
MRASISIPHGRVVVACSAAAVLVVAVALTMSWLAGSPLTARGETQPSATPPAATQDRLPDGWRWESYAGVEAAVPDSWEHGTTGTPPCLQPKGRAPYVGRPGPVESIGCVEQVPKLAHRTSYLWLGDGAARPGVRKHDSGWVEETRVVGGVGLTVFTDDASVRERVLASARVAGRTDSYGCPVDHRVSANKLVTPAAGEVLPAVSQIRSIIACRYMIERDDRSEPLEPLLSASRLAQPAAQRLVDAILAAPAGSGPNNPSSCLRSYAYGDEVLVLRVAGSAGDREIFLRYSGCDGHGTYDGEGVRRLTSDVLRPLLDEGPHRMMSGSAQIGRLLG